jgi:hypothetical protein
MTSCPGLSRLRGRSRFGEAKARASALLRAKEKNVDGRDKPGHDGVGGLVVIASAAKQSMLQRVWTDGLLRCARNDADSSVRKYPATVAPLRQLG